MLNLMFQPLRKYADFQGRAARAEYWMFLLMVILVEIVCLMLNGGKQVGIGTFILGVFGLAILVPALAVGVRRLHDTNRSGWWLLIGLIPFLGGLVLLVFYVLDGTPGANRFGPDPKGRDLTTIFA